MDILRRSDGKIVLVDKVKTFIVGPELNRINFRDKKGADKNVSDTIKRFCPKKLRKRKNHSESDNG